MTLDLPVPIGFWRKLLWKLSGLVLLYPSVFRSNCFLIQNSHARGYKVEKEQPEHAEAFTDAENALRLYGTSILRTAYSYLHSMADAEDIVQDTLLQLMKTQPSFDSSAHQKAWLLRVAMNLSKNKLKSAARSGVELSEEYPADDMENNLRFVWDAVRELPEQYRGVIHLFYHEGYSTAEIASILEKKESTVRSLLHRARGMLKTTLKGAYDFDDSIQ